MAASEDELGSTAFFSPGWIAGNGGYIHSNNVLFYFMESPFFDRTSTNQSVVTQNSGIPDREYAFLSTRKKFEQALSRLVGLQYVVAHDPLESKAQITGPNGAEQSEIWVIRKQIRNKTDGTDDDIVVRRYYYIMNGTIYQAPSVADILSYRMLNTALTMKNVFSTTSTLPVFTASHGHTYHKPVQRTAAPTTLAVQQSKENTPMPDVRPSATDKDPNSTDKKVPTSSSARTLHEALQMTMRYGKEYMDDMPLIGEPGNFRFTKNKDPTTTPGHLRLPSTNQPTASKPGTPAPPSTAASPPPPIKTDVPPAQSKKSSAKSPMPGDPPKPRRRKSKAANQSP